MAQVATTQTITQGASAQGQPLQTAEGASAASFGGASAAALGDLGSTDRQAADTITQRALAFQAINNKVAADGATNTAIDQIDNARLDYEKNHPGLAAADPANLAAFHQTLSDIHKSAGQGLSPLAQVEYDSAVRRYVGAAQASTASFAQTQRVQGINQQAAATTQLWTSKMAANPDDPTIQAEGARQIASQAAMLQALHGGSDDEAKAYIQVHLGAVYQGQIHNAVNSGDQDTAQRLLAAHKDDMTEAQLTAALGEVKMGQASYGASSEALAWSQGHVLANDPYVQAVHTREGTGQNPRSSANGVGQFTAPTWLEVLKNDPQFAGDIKGMSDQQILALRTNPQVADRAIESYRGTNAQRLTAAGVPVTNSNLGLAHGFGAGGAQALLAADPTTPVSQVLPAQVLAANPQLLNQTAGQVRADFDRRFGTTNANDNAQSAWAKLVPPVITNYDNADKFLADTRDTARAYADGKYADNPQMAARTYSSIMARAEQDAQSMKERQSANYGDALSYAMGNNIKDVSAMPPAMMSALPARYQKSLEATIRQQANEVTPAQQLQIADLEGKRAAAANGQPGALLSTDVQSLALPPAVTQRYLNAQADARNHKAFVAQSDKVTAQIIHSDEGRAALNSLGIDYKPTNTPEQNSQYFQFSGAISALVESYMDTNKKPPDAPTMRNFVAQVTSKVGRNTGWWSDNRPALFQVPDAFKQDVLGKAAQRGQILQEPDIARLYMQAVADGKVVPGGQ